MRQTFFCLWKCRNSAPCVNLPCDVTDFIAIKHICVEEQIELVVVGPEQPLVEGIVDFFREDKILQDIAIIGPDKHGARLEGSKALQRLLCVNTVFQRLFLLM